MPQEENIICYHCEVLSLLNASFTGLIKSILLKDKQKDPAIRVTEESQILRIDWQRGVLPCKFHFQVGKYHYCDYSKRLHEYRMTER